MFLDHNALTGERIQNTNQNQNQSTDAESVSPLIWKALSDENAADFESVVHYSAAASSSSDGRLALMSSIIV